MNGDLKTGPYMHYMHVTEVAEHYYLPLLGRYKINYLKRKDRSKICRFRRNLNQNSQNAKFENGNKKQPCAAHNHYAKLCLTQYVVAHMLAIQGVHVTNPSTMIGRELQ